MNFKKRYILVKMMSIIGVDPSPMAANAIQTRNLKIQPYEGATVALDYDRATMGNSEEIKTAPNTLVSFDVFLSGSGVAGTAPGFGPLLRACGFAQSIEANVSATYDPISNGFESIALYYDIDGQRHVVLDAMGTVTFNMAKGEVPYMSFTFTGIYKTPTAAVMVTPAPANFGKPIPFNKANTPESNIGDVTYPMESFSVDIANQVVHRNLPGSESIAITDRAPAGSVVVEAPPIGAHDFFADVESHDGITKQSMEIRHGTVDGNICTISAPQVQLSSIEYQDSDGIATYSMSTLLIQNTGDDEISIAFT